MQDKNVKSNATDAMFLAFTMVQQMMTELSGAATEEGNVTVIMKAVFSLL
jgi:precorrin-4 methylase